MYVLGLLLVVLILLVSIVFRRKRRRVLARAISDLENPIEILIENELKEPMTDSESLCTDFSHKDRETCSLATMREYIYQMRACLDLAEEAMHTASPNPMVGCCLMDGKGNLLAEGYHEKPGTPHAEVVCLSKYSGPMESCTLFSSLEPCCHTKKKTPPCTDVIIQRSPRLLVCATEDPNPQVNGHGLQLLQEHGIEVINKVSCSRALWLNRFFFTCMREDRPRVVCSSISQYSARGKRLYNQVDAVIRFVSDSMTSIGFSCFSGFEKTGQRPYCRVLVLPQPPCDVDFGTCFFSLFGADSEPEERFEDSRQPRTEYVNFVLIARPVQIKRPTMARTRTRNVSLKSSSKEFFDQLHHHEKVDVTVMHFDCECVRKGKRNFQFFPLTILSLLNTYSVRSVVFEFTSDTILDFKNPLLVALNDSTLLDEVWLETGDEEKVKQLRDRLGFTCNHDETNPDEFSLLVRTDY